MNSEIDFNLCVLITFTVQNAKMKYCFVINNLINERVSFLKNRKLGRFFVKFFRNDFLFW